MRPRIRLIRRLITDDQIDVLRIAWRKSFRGAYFGLNGLDKKLEEYINYDNGYFVELGANNGYSQSNTFHFQHKRGWKGVLVEPTPHNYLKCLKYRGDNCKVFCNACVPFGFDDCFVQMTYADLMSFSDTTEMGSQSQEAHLSKATSFMRDKEQVFTFGAVARPLSDLLDEANAPSQIDLLSLDVEGAELGVLKGIDHLRHRFKFMLIECIDQDAIESYLIKHGYRLIDRLSHHDLLFAS